MFDQPARKLCSGILRTTRLVASLSRMALARLANSGVSIPWSTTIGRGVTIQITDGASLQIGHGVSIGAGSVISAKYGAIIIGDAAHIGHGCVIVGKSGIRIGARALVAEYVTIRDHDHCVDQAGSIVDAGFNCAPISLGDDSWLGAKVTVLRGAEIGSGAVIGAHALVKGVIPDFAIAVGIPARVSRYRRSVDLPTA